MATPAPASPREVFGWAMFDFANSSYTTVIVTVAFSVYFTSSVAPPERADLLWGLAVGISNILVLLTAPLIGAAADDSGRKKPFLAATYLICVAGTAALYFVTPGSVVAGITLFVLSNIAYAHGENLVGAFLPEISTADTAGRISGLGWGLGYFGGLAKVTAPAAEANCRMRKSATSSLAEKPSVVRAKMPLKATAMVKPSE